MLNGKRKPRYEPRRVMTRDSAVFGLRVLFLFLIVVFGGVFLGRVLKARTSSDSRSEVTLKERKEQETRPGIWAPLEQTEQLDPNKTAIVICDMWDNHWCNGAAKRVQKLAARMVPVLDAARGTYHPCTVRHDRLLQGCTSTEGG
jgi:hypothetical protein